MESSFFIDIHTMINSLFYNLLEIIERIGIWLSITALLTVFIGTVIMIYVNRNERRKAVWIPSSIIGIIATTANFLDFAVTLHISPDLTLEANPIWRNVVDNWGLTIAVWYGFTGKLFVSALSVLMFAFYIRNRDVLFPKNANSLFKFIKHMGNVSQTIKQRIKSIFTVFSFFFACIQPFYFYIAYLNWNVNSGPRSELIFFFIPLIITLLLIAIIFIFLTYRAFCKERLA
jgi:hypothetical protein